MKVIIIILFLMTCGLLSAQQPYARNLTIEDGLPSMEIYDMYQDSRGYMWLATDGGLCRYDIHSIKKYHHPLEKGVAVSRILEDNKGQIWYKNFKGQLFYTDNRDSVNLFEVPDSIKFGVYSNYHISNNKLILGTNQLYIYDLDKKTWETKKNKKKIIETSSAIVDIGSCESGSIFYTNYLQELWEIKNGISICYGKFDPQKFPASKNIGPNSIAFFDNKVYSDSIHKITKLDKESRVADFSSVVDSKTKKVLIKNVFSDKENNFWICTTNGVYIYGRNHSGKWQQSAHYLEGKQISCVFFDREGNTWIATLQNGIFILPSTKINYYTKENSSLSNSYLNKIEKDSEGHLLLGGSDGVVMRFDPKTELVKNKYTGTNSNVLSILFDKKREQVLFSTDRLHIAKWKTSGDIISVDEKISGHQHSIYKKDFLIEVKKHFTWIYSMPEKFDENTPVNTGYTKTKIKANQNGVDKNYQIVFKFLQNSINTTALYVNKRKANQFWLGCRDTLFLYTNEIPEAILSPEGKNFIALDITQTEDGTVWVGTMKNGIYKIKGKKVLANYRIEDGLPSNFCNTLSTYKNDVWCGTDKGIIKIDGKNQKISVFNKTDGLISDRIRDIEIAEGKVWAATLKGLISFGINTPSANKTRPNIFITSVNINKNQCLYQQNPELRYDENNLKFQFQTTAVKGMDNILYEYRLWGLDSTWVQLPVSTNFVSYQGLTYAKYTFDVRAINEDGVKSISPASYSFYIAPPYWYTWWYLSLKYFIIFSIISLIIYWQFREFKKKHFFESSMKRLKMQALQSQMNPHFVFNAMSTIQSYWVQKKSKTALIYHAKFAKLMRLIFDYSNELSIEIEKELEFLKTYISLEKIRYEEDIEVLFEISEEFLSEDINIPPLLIQPIIENSFKHGLLHKKEKGKLLIGMKREGNYVYCIIEDDGIGREKAKEYTSWKRSDTKKRSSLKLTEERLEILNQSYGDPNKVNIVITDIKNSKNEASGTRTELWIPVINQH
jgi:ligand-binding sensor domain-containing protein